MRSILSSASGAIRRGLFFLIFLAATLPLRAAMVDTNGDGVSDIWALKYGVQGGAGFAATGDTDGDGIVDGAEATAGTDPYSAGSTIKVSGMVLDGSGLRLTFPTQAGKGYVVQKSASISPATWATANPLVSGQGGEQTVTLPAAGATDFFYRVLVQDIDSDGDGVNDWEEIAAGFDPKNSYSNGLSAANDLARITEALGAVNVVTVVATDTTAAEPAAGAPATQTGAFEIRRSGNLNAITVTYTLGGTASVGDYAGLSGSVTLGLGVNAATVLITPVADALIESPESVLLTANAGASYTVGTPATDVLVIDDKATANGTGVTARFWNNTSATIPVFSNTTGATNGSAVPVLTRVDPQVNLSTTSTVSPGAGVNATYFVTRFTGEVLPDFSQIYTFTGQVERGGRLWVNGQLIFSSWSSSPTAGTYNGTIELQAGKRVPIVFEHMARSSGSTAILSWQSTNQPLQVIPQDHLFPATPPQILSALELLLIKNSPLTTYQIVASGEPTSYGAANLPQGWSVNSSTGLISGTPTVAGTFPIVLTATNAAGSGSAILNLTVIETGGAITRDVWSGSYADVAELPLADPPSGTGLVSVLEGPLAPGGGDQGTRLRGYLTAPQTGVYKFWIAGSDAAELWISDDDEPVNLFLRAATAGATGHRAWTNVNAGKSALLMLYAGQRYAVEVRHVDAGGDGHVSIGWIKPSEGGSDPAAVTTPSEVVPGYALSPYVQPAIISGQSTLFATSMTAQGAAVTSGYGSASLRMSADESQAILTHTHANLTTPVTGEHIHAGTNGEIIFDIDTAVTNPDGSHTWQIGQVGAFSAADIVNLIKAGNTYINIHTANYPAGEIKGFFKLQAASQTFTAPAPQTWADPASAGSPESHLNPNAASRFLAQASFGASAAEIAQVQALGFEGWIDDQITKPATLHYPLVYANRNQTDPANSTYSGTLSFNAWWRNSVTGADQLRQRVAFALSEIMVVSENGPLDDKANAISSYYDMLLGNAFGNVRTLLQDVTLHPAMGRYLDMLRNRRPDLATGRIPNENYAREIKQLFSIGLYRMHPDGSLMLNSKGELIPTYDQDAIIGFAHVFTGWDYYYTGTQTSQSSFGAAENWISPMREVPTLHFTGQKRLLNNVVLPGLTVAGGSALDPYKTHTSTQYNDPAYQALPMLELNAAHDALFKHPNIGPFLCRQLIQRLVTSTPSRGYIHRVVQKFNDNGSGVRGDMVAVIKAILLDYEARSAALLNQQGYGKLREPVARVTALARAFPAPAPITGNYTQTGSLITVTTPVNHLYSNGHSVPLEFSEATSGDSGAPLPATYTISDVTPQSFTVRVRSFEGGVTYEQVGASTKLTATGNGFYPGVNDSVYVEYLDGTPSAPASGVDVIEYRSSDELIIYLGVPGAKRATYSQTAGSSNLVVTSSAHGYLVDASLQIDFVSGTGVTGLYTVTAVTTNTFTVTASDTLARSGSAIVVAAASAVPLATGTANVTRVSAGAEFANRSGTAVVTYSDWNMSTTDTDLNQTPLGSPTVFNFFLPDYQFPGILGEAGLITPEFEITSETSVIRQANFLYNGLFNDGLSQLGLSSFKSAARDIFVDLRPWMGNPPSGTSGVDTSKPWVDDANLDGFLGELNTLLMAGQLPSTGTNTYGAGTPASPRIIVNAKDAVRTYIATLPFTKALTGITTASPCVLTVNGHGMTNGQTVTISGVTGGNFSGAGINGTFTVANATTNTFTVGVNRTSGGTTLGLSAAKIATPPGFPDLIRDRLRSSVHLLITSPDFTTQK